MAVLDESAAQDTSHRRKDKKCSAEDTSTAKKGKRAKVSHGADAAGKPENGSSAADGLSMGAATDVHRNLFSRGYVEFQSGLPWLWELVSFVEDMYDRYHEEVERRLTEEQESWTSEEYGYRPGSTAAEKVTKAMEAAGVAVYSPPPSAAEEAPWDTSGPRFYVSVTAAAWKRWPDGAPAPPDELAGVLWPHRTDAALVSGKWPNMIRGLGWALAPPKSDPQELHADIWGDSDKPRPGRVRFHHFLWKRQAGTCCTTQIVPGGFTDGKTREEHYGQMTRARAPCILVDNEVLHRGAANKSDRWVSTCSIELCTRTGYEEVWKGGGEDDGIYQMLPIRWARQHEPNLV
eukprot:TRINITY_DN62524_c0_g1_i1.p1 TRINITY_DN62524_c0_g1~~TRINITY_DN62524_c0_g1_i1.p1  ORF type:complete len:347 (+),score=71.84 TRINITY_DN62524_c0_g1_i1:56-1096(+)